MARLQFGTSSFQRARGDLPELPVVNMFVEPAETEETGIAVQSRPGLSDRSADMGLGPVKAVFRKDGVLFGSLFGVSGSRLYRDTTAIGEINGTGPFFMAGYEDKVFLAGGGAIWGYDGTTLGVVSFPDSANVTAITVGASRLIAIRLDTETFYWSDVLSDTIDGLSFATAESQPDRLRDLLFIDGVLVLFGAETVESWPSSSDADRPFQPLPGRIFEKGIRATGCAAKIGSSFAWVTDGNEVCLGEPDAIISNPGLEAEIEASSSVRLWTYRLEGMEFLALTLDSGTWSWSWRSKLWSQQESYGEANWIPHCFSGGVFGSSIDGRTIEWGDDHLDFGGVLERRLRGGLVINAGGLTINNLIARVNVGHTPYLTGTYAAPVVEARFSRDAGNTWGNWRAKPLGGQGEYRKRVQWAGCGMFGQPGMMVELRCTDPVPFRISDLRVNESFGGL